MTAIRFILITGVLMCAVGIHPIAAKMYKWTDANGVTHFSDVPPDKAGQSIETYETSEPPQKKITPKPAEGAEKSDAPEENRNPAAKLKISTGDLLGKWTHLGVSKKLPPEKISKPYKPQSWEFMSDGTMIYRIGDKQNRCPFKLDGNTIVTTPFPNTTKSFVVVKISLKKMVWQDPDWKSYIHVERRD